MAASIVALVVPVVGLAIPMVGCGSSSSAPPPGQDGGGGSDVMVQPGQEAGPPSGDGGTGGDVATTPGTMLVPLTATSTGYVMNATTGITGAFYAYGDGWGTEGYMGMTGVAGERGNCELKGGFSPAQCSSISSPLPAAPQVDAGTAPPADGGEAGTTMTPPPPAGYDNGFPPEGDSGAAAQSFCITGVAAAVIMNDAGVTDYSDIFGIGMGLDFNNVGGVKGPYDATLNKVVGVQFTLSAGGTFPPVRVEFPTEETVDGGPMPTGDSYDISPTAAGVYKVLWTQFAGPPTVGAGGDLSYAPTVDGGINAQPAFDPAMLLSLQVHVPTATGAAVTVTNLCISDLNAIVSTK